MSPAKEEAFFQAYLRALTKAHLFITACKFFGASSLFSAWNIQLKWSVRVFDKIHFLQHYRQILNSMR